MVDIDNIIDLYLNHEMSSRMVSRETGVPKTQVSKILKDMGVSRSKEEALSVAKRKGRTFIPSGELNPRYKNGVTIDKKSGIYFLMEDEDVVYIGKSLSNMSNRLCRHVSEETKTFNKAVCFEIENDSDIHILELYLINKHKPKYNIDAIGSSDTTIDIKDIDKLVVDKSVYSVNGNNELEKALVNKSCPIMNMNLIRNF